MRGAMTAEDFRAWFDAFLPSFDPSSFGPVLNVDHTDPAGVHLYGLNLSRAWCLRNVADALGQEHPRFDALHLAADRHAEVGLKHVASGEFMGEHWLPTFAVYMLATPGPE